jgi:hypothetical protein
MLTFNFINNYSAKNDNVYMGDIPNKQNKILKP